MRATNYKQEVNKLSVMNSNASAKGVVDRMFFCILMSITFFVYCIIGFFTIPLSAWEKAQELFAKESNSIF